MLDYSEIINLSDIQETKTRWLGRPYFPLGKLTIVQGDPGEGKTTFMLNLIAVYTNPHNKERPPIHAIYLNAEDGLADTIKPRLIAANANCDYVHTIDESHMPLTLDDQRIEDAIVMTGARLLVIDPLQAYLGPDVDMHRANEIRPVMSRLAAVAERTGCAIVLVGHMNKAQGMKSTYRGLGSIDLVAAARSVIVIAKDKSNPDVRVIAQIKNSLAPIPKPSAFKIKEGGEIDFIDEYECDVEDLLMGIGTDADYNEALNILREELKEGEKPQRELMEKISHLNIPQNKLRKIKNSLGVKSVKIHNSWYWTTNTAQKRDVETV